jgi:membrane protease subunit HflK
VARDPEEEPLGSDQRIQRQVGRMIANWLAVGISLAVIGGWAYTGIYQLEPGEAAVVLRVGKYSRTVTEPGLKWLWPAPIEEFRKVNIAEVRREKFGLAEGADRMQPTAETAGFENAIQTADSNIVNLSYEVQYSIEDPFSFLYIMAKPQETLRDAAQSAVREVVGRTGVDGVLYEDRSRIQMEARAGLQATLGRYFAHLDQKSAFDIGLVNLNIVQAPPEVQDAFDDVVAAKQDAERASSKARGDAQEIRERANAQAIELRQSAAAYKESRILEAGGEAQRFVALQEEYARAPEVTRRRLYLETLEQVLPDVEKVIVEPETVNLIPFFPLPGRAPAPAPAEQGEGER